MTENEQIKAFRKHDIYTANIIPALEQTEWNNAIRNRKKVSIDQSNRKQGLLLNVFMFQTARNY